MAHLTSPHAASERSVSYFWSGEVLRSRSVSGIVLSGGLDIPALPPRLVADWNRDLSKNLHLECGAVEPLSLPRACTRWPEYRQCAETAAEWVRMQGLGGLLATCDIALMVCRGARFHHDGAQYGSSVFCNLFMTEDKGLDVVFPAAGRRIPLVRGSIMLFDTCQPHAVVLRGSNHFDPAAFESDPDTAQVFLTWEIPVENSDVARVLGIRLDEDPLTALTLHSEQVLVDGVPATVCPATGQWCRSTPALPGLPQER